MAYSRSANRDIRLAGERLVLRPVTTADLVELSVWDEDPEIVRLMGKKFGEQGHTLGEWYRRALTDRSFRALAIESRDGGLIGEIELDRIEWRNRTAELRILIGAKRLWGRGLGTDAIRMLLRVAFAQWGFRHIYLRVYRHNLRAIRCYLALGFQIEGILTPSRRREDDDAVLLMSVTAERFLQLFAEIGSEVG